MSETEAENPPEIIPRCYFWQHTFFLLLLSLFSGAFITLCLRLYLFFAAGNPADTPDGIDLPEPSSAQFDQSLLDLKPAAARAEDAVIFKIWQAQTDAEKYPLYVQLQKKHPKTRHFRSIERHLTILEAQKNAFAKEADAKRKQEEKLKNREREDNAYREYTKALNVFSEVEKRNLLGKLITNHPGTKAAKQAQDMLAAIDKNIRSAEAARVAAEKAEKANRKQAQSRALEDKIGHPREVFISQYRSALRKWDISLARKLAQSLAESKKIPELNYFGEGCLSDVKELQSLTNIMRGYFQHNIGKDIQLKVGKGSRMNGRITKVTADKVNILVSNRFPQSVEYPQGIFYKTALEIYEANASPGSTSTSLMGGILLYALGENELAIEYFKKVGEANPRREIHEKILSTEF